MKPKPQIEPVYQLKISLKTIEPPIWRRVHVRGGILLPRLHTVFQKAMGWRDAHLHEFVIRDVHYGEPEPDEPHYEVEPERNFSLREVAPLASLRFEYVYDLGDGWSHDVLVEQIDLPAEPLRSPVCLGGERAARPRIAVGSPATRSCWRSSAIRTTRSMRSAWTGWAAASIPRCSTWLRLTAS